MLRVKWLFSVVHSTARDLAEGSALPQLVAGSRCRSQVHAFTEWPSLACLSHPQVECGVRQPPAPLLAACFVGPAGCCLAPPGPTSSDLCLHCYSHRLLLRFRVSSPMRVCPPCKPAFPAACPAHPAVTTQLDACLLPD